MPKAFDRAVLERELGIVTHKLHQLGDQEASSPERQELEQQRDGLLALLDAMD